MWEARQNSISTTHLFTFAFGDKCAQLFLKAAGTRRRRRPAYGGARAQRTGPGRQVPPWPPYRVPLGSHDACYTARHAEGGSRSTLPSGHPAPERAARLHLRPAGWRIARQTASSWSKTLGRRTCLTLEHHTRVTWDTATPPPAGAGGAGLPPDGGP